MGNNRIDEVESIESSGSKRNKAWEMAREQMQNNMNSRKEKQSSQDDTGTKKDSTLIENSVQKNQEHFNESYDDSGSISGSYNAGSTILGSQSANTDTDGGGSSSGGGSRQKGDSIKVESDKLPKGKLQKVSLSLFGDNE